MKIEKILIITILKYKIQQQYKYNKTLLNLAGVVERNLKLFYDFMF